MKVGNDIVRKEMENFGKIIKEEDYQQIKKKMCKKDDYFTEKELNKFVVNLS